MKCKVTWTLNIAILKYLHVVLNMLIYWDLFYFHINTLFGERFKENNIIVIILVEIKQIAVYQHIFCLAVEWDNISVTINDKTHCLAHFKCPDTDQSIIHLNHGHTGLHTELYTVEQPWHIYTASCSLSCIHI